MTKETTRELLNHSCDWIREHWDARNLDVPDHFLQRWIYQAGDNEAAAEGFYLAVFSFGLLQHELISNRMAPGDKRSFPAALVLEFFSKWQLKLALAEVHRLTELRIRPLALFSFPEGEEIEVWHESRPAPGVPPC